jgi:hypothetical protein
MLTHLLGRMCEPAWKTLDGPLLWGNDFVAAVTGVNAASTLCSLPPGSAWPQARVASGAPPALSHPTPLQPLTRDTGHVGTTTRPLRMASTSGQGVVGVLE